MEEKKYTVMRADDGKLYIDTGGKVESRGELGGVHYIWNPLKSVIDPQNWVEGETVSDKEWTVISGSLNRIRRVL